MTKVLTAMGNDVIFQFAQNARKVNEGNLSSQAFHEETEWGFEFHNFNESTSMPRWGKVVTLGPKVTNEVAVGDMILIEPLKWTNHTIVNGQQVWKTTEDHILAIEVRD